MGFKERDMVGHSGPAPQATSEAAAMTASDVENARQFLKSRGHWQDPVYVTYSQLMRWFALALAEERARVEASRDRLLMEKAELEVICERGLAKRDARIAELEAERDRLRECIKGYTSRPTAYRHPSDATEPTP